jgi:predicted nucleic acid-binding protein
VTDFTLDANVLVYAADSRNLPRQLAALRIVERAAMKDAILLSQALAEFFHAVTRKNLVPIADAQAQVARWTRMFARVPAGYGSAELLLATQARASGRFQFWDAMLLATAASAGCVALISEDMAHDASLGPITVVRAFDGNAVSPEALALLA